MFLKKYEKKTYNLPTAKHKEISYIRLEFKKTLVWMYIGVNQTYYQE